MKHIIAKRVPPGDRWSIENDEVVHTSLTDCLNAIFMKNGVKTDGDKIAIICNEEDQIQKVIKNMTKPGNCVFEGYEEWDEKEDMKWILTFRLLDDYERYPDLN